MAIDRYTCEDVFRRLDDYLDRELGAEETLRLEEHLATCARCAAEHKFEASFLAELKQKVRRIAVPQGLMGRIARLLDDLPEGRGEGGRG